MELDGIGWHRMRSIGIRWDRVEWPDWDGNEWTEIDWNVINLHAMESTELKSNILEWNQI